MPVDPAVKIVIGTRRVTHADFKHSAGDDFSLGEERLVNLESEAPGVLFYLATFDSNERSSE